MNGPSNFERILQAADQCVSRWGWAKTTIDDIASEAEVSRATVYRTFSGGRDSIYDAVRRERVKRFFSSLAPIVAEEDDLLEALTEAIAVSVEALHADEALQYQLVHEPGQVLQLLSFRGLDRLLAAARVYLVPHLSTFVDRQSAVELAEWATRVVLTYFLAPSPTVDLRNRDEVRSLLLRRIPRLATASETPFAARNA